MHINRAVKYKKKKKKIFKLCHHHFQTEKKFRKTGDESSETGQKQKYTLPNHRRGRLF